MTIGIQPYRSFSWRARELCCKARTHHLCRTNTCKPAIQTAIHLLPEISGIRRECARGVICCAAQLAPARPTTRKQTQLPLSHKTESTKQTIDRLHPLVAQWSAAPDWDVKLELLQSDDRVRRFATSCRGASRVVLAAEQLSAQHACMILCLPVICQEHVLLAQPGGDVDMLPSLLRLAEALGHVDHFFSSLGGLPWYHLRCLQFIDEATTAQLHSTHDSTASHSRVKGTENRQSDSGNRSAGRGSETSSRSSGTGVRSTSFAAECSCGGHGVPNSFTTTATAATSYNTNADFDFSVFGDDTANSANGSSNGSVAAADILCQQQWHMPSGVDLQHDPAAARRAVAKGIQSLPYMAEIYPIGGAGDRLGLIDEKTGESVPTAMLPYCGRTLLESLLRDLQAREVLHWRLTGRQVVTPIALMTSDAKGNHRRITSLLESLSWMGRGEDSFRLFRQPMVPVVGAAGGRWPMAGPLAPMMKPGGHGAIWKLMVDNGIFEWLKTTHRRDAAVVRQISNPLAGTDDTLLALTGTGYMGGKLFGFASCPRAVGASEGMNVLSERRVPVSTASCHSTAGATSHYEYGITNIEYTEFKRLGIRDEAQSEGSHLSVFPANTNLLYLSLQAAEKAVRKGSGLLPGLIFNAAKMVEEPLHLTGGGSGSTSVAAGRLECTMQNLADSLVQSFPTKVAAGRHSELHTFVQFNKRRKVTSSAKRRRREGSLVVAQTPDGSFRDLLANARELLVDHCNFESVPEVGEVAEYLENGPSFIFLFHPALGPLWDVIGQKLRGGRMAPQAEVVLEVADADITNLRVDGSLLVTATAVVGHFQAPSQPPQGPRSSTHPLPPSHVQPTSLDSLEGLFYDGSWAQAVPALEYQTMSQQSGVGQQQAPAGRLVMSTRCGRVRLCNVTVQNDGIEWESPHNVFWRHQVVRRQSARIVVHGNAEFEACDVMLSGDCSFSVPEGHRMLVSQGVDGGLAVTLGLLPDGQPTWGHSYDMAADGRICVSLRQSTDRSSPLKSGGGYDMASSTWSRGKGSAPSEEATTQGDSRHRAIPESDTSWFSSQL